MNDDFSDWTHHLKHHLSRLDWKTTGYKIDLTSKDLVIHVVRGQGVDAVCRGSVDAAANWEVEHAALVTHGGGQHGLHRLNFLPHPLHNHSLCLNPSQILSILRVRVPSLHCAN